MTAKQRTPKIIHSSFGDLYVKRKGPGKPVRAGTSQEAKWIYWVSSDGNSMSMFGISDPGNRSNFLFMKDKKKLFSVNRVVLSESMTNPQAIGGRDNRSFKRIVCKQDNSFKLKHVESNKYVAIGGKKNNRLVLKRDIEKAVCCHW